MARYSAGARAAGAGSATLPQFSVYNTAAVMAKIVEIGIFNTTTTAAVVGLCRLSTTGTQGAAVTGHSLDANAAAPACGGFNTHTVAPTLVDLGYRTTLGAVAGAGVIWTFGGPTGLTAALATTGGIGIYVPTGTGQICDIYVVWDE